MASKKKDLEIVYNLQWKNRPIICDEKSNMVGMYDIPATTLNWDTFKLYLLKNSGYTGDDVKVSYINSDDKEVAIESQLDFQIALYLFRQRARLNEIITLKLDRIMDKKSKPMLFNLKKVKQLSDVQVQVENNQLQRTPSFNDEPPDWFVKYMTKFKDEIVEEISTTVCSNKSSNICQAGSHHSRKSKVETYKRSRKTPLLLGDIRSDINNDKDKRKLENKLEKLEHKTMKIKAKKMALRVSSDSDVGRGSNKSRPIGVPPSDSEILMNASALNNFETTIPHMSGGETYLQKWKVINSGKLAWTAETELRYAWGSQAFTPVDKRVPCPHLNPGEEGTVAVLLDIPTTSGSYECYWHFHHNGRRFGHWVGCQVIVDEPPVKMAQYLPPTKYDVINIKDMYELVLPTSWTSSPKKIKTEQSNSATAEGLCPCDYDKAIKCSEGQEDSNKLATCFPVDIFNGTQPQKCDETQEQGENPHETNDFDNTLENVNTSLRNMKITTNADCDSDIQSIISISDSNSSVNSVSSEEFVVVPASDLIDEEVKRNFEKWAGIESPEKFVTVSAEQCNEVDDDQKQINILQKFVGKESSAKFNIGTVPVELSNEIIDDQNQHNILQKLVDKESCEKFNIGTVSAELLNEIIHDQKKNNIQAGRQSTTAVPAELQKVVLEPPKVFEFTNTTGPNLSYNKHESCEKFNIGNMSAALPNEIGDDQNKNNIQAGRETSGAAPAELQKVKLERPGEFPEELDFTNATAPNLSYNTHESDGNNNTEQLSPITRQDAPMDLSNKCSASPNGENPGTDKSGYAYIYYGGQKIPIAKEYLRPDYLATAEEVCSANECFVELCEDDTNSTKNEEGSNELANSFQRLSQSEYLSIDSTFNESHCSALGSSFSDKTNTQSNSKRFFVFPQSYPGYEVVNLPSQCLNSSQHLPADSHLWRNNLVEPPMEVLVNDWTTGQNFPPNYTNCYSNCNPFIKNGFNFEQVGPNFTTGGNTYTNLPTPQESLNAHTPNGVNSNPFDIHRSPDSNCPYKINEHTLAGCNSSNCKLEHGSERHPQFETRSTSINSPRSCSSQSTSSQTYNKIPRSAPDNLLTGAAIAATSAMNTARSVLNMFVNPRSYNIGKWENGHWVSTDPESKREKSLNILHEMGFYNRDLNATLLARYNDDITKVIFELVP